MRWILVFLFLYLIPLLVLFRNYKDFKRSCIYSSIYIVLVSTIVITNMYISGLNKIKEAMYYQNYVLEQADNDKYASKFDKEYEPQDLTQSINENQESNKEENEKTVSEIIKEDKIIIAKEKIQPEREDDKDIIFKFKKEIYDIENIALIPMRDCMPYTKDISQNIKNLVNIKKDLEYAKDKCQEVIKIYDEMEIPALSSDEYTNILDNARNDVKKAYELREKAMAESIKLVETKNPKYVGKITEYLKLSDNHIANFKERLSDLNNNIK